jgi:membrane protein implicated in regulation of membrane protease activity
VVEKLGERTIMAGAGAGGFRRACRIIREPVPWETRDGGMRTRLAIAFNLFVPGAGLILLRREWLGVSAALLFGILAEVAVLGTLVLPATVPPWMTTLCLSAAVFVWLGAQWRLWVRIRSATGPALERQMAALVERAAEAVARRAYAEATELLQVAMTLDDEDLPASIRWAELMTLMGRFGQARRAWRRVLQLDRSSGRHRRQALEALASLPQG